MSPKLVYSPFPPLVMFMYYIVNMYCSQTNRERLHVMQQNNPRYWECGDVFACSLLHSYMDLHVYIELDLRVHVQHVYNVCAIILRNHILQTAIEQAEKGDFSEVITTHVHVYTYLYSIIVMIVHVHVIFYTYNYVLYMYM